MRNGCNTCNTRQQLNKLGSVFLTNREVSAQEAVYRVLSIPLQRCSKSVVFINTDKESRDALLLPFSQLQKLNDDNEDVYCKNIIDRYSARPKHCEDMCLAQFAASYTYNRQHENLLEKMKMNLRTNSTQTFQGIVMR